MKLRNALGTIAAIALAAGGAQAQQLTPITFTATQANAGQIAFASNCQVCHGDALEGGRGPALVGSGFAARFLGQPVGELYRYISTYMPFDNAGALAPVQYVNIVAFIARENGFVAGDAPLPGNIDVLNAMSFR